MLKSNSSWVVRSVAETVEIGRAIGKALKPGSIVCLFGDLGAGKTTITQGLCEGITGVVSHNVVSPTFVYMNHYRGETDLYHFDLYRLTDVDEFLGMGFDEFFYSGGVSCVEWSERIEALLPEDRIELVMEHLSESERRVTIRGLETHGGV